ncbi:membrane protein [Gordonia phage DalanDe]|nr:membrane protein [Gordonia phage DalanDe]
MSQPLSQRLGRKVPIEQTPEKGPRMTSPLEVAPSETRVLPVRSVVALILLLTGLVCIPVGVGMVAGTGAAIIAVGALSLALGVATERL